MHSAECQTLHTAVGFLDQLLDVQRIDQPVHCKQNIGLLVCGINSLRNCDEADSVELQLFLDSVNIAEIPREAAGIIHHDDAKRARFESGRRQQRFHPRRSALTAEIASSEYKCSSATIQLFDAAYSLHFRI